MTENADQMAPDASPGEVSKKAGVRRVNNMPMYILGGVLLSFVLVMALVAADRAAKQNAPADGPKEKAGNTSMFAKEIVATRPRLDRAGKPAQGARAADRPGVGSAGDRAAVNRTRRRLRQPATRASR
jgi:type IV secretion system protein VirB10